jgi:hypothetical protein
MGVSSSGSVMMAIEVKDGKPTEEQIRIRAHELWEQAGKPEDRDDEFWLLAEKDLREKPEHSKSTIVPE